MFSLSERMYGMNYSFDKEYKFRLNINDLFKLNYFSMNHCIEKFNYTYCNVNHSFRWNEKINCNQM